MEAHHVADRDDPDAEARVGVTLSPAAAPGDYESWDDYMADIEHVETVWHDQDAQRGLKAMRLAPSLAVCRALLDGQDVPRNALDPGWLRRYGI